MYNYARVDICFEIGAWLLLYKYIRVLKERGGRYWLLVL